MATFTGTTGDDTLIGGSGDDSLSGLAGNDSLAGGAGSDTLGGGDGNDYLYSASFAADAGLDVDSLFGGAGRDVVFVGWGDSADGGPDRDYLDVSFLGATAGVNADFRLLAPQTPVVIEGGTYSNFETINSLTGSEFDDYLANWGDYDSHGAGPIYGRGGDDHIVPDDYTSWILGGDGNDLIDGASAWNAGGIWNGEAGDDTIVGAYQLEKILGGEGNDSLVGEIHCRVEGGAGNDTLVADWYGTLVGGDGDDRLVSSGQGDAMSGGSGVDTAVYPGNFAAYEITLDGSTGIFTVRESPYVSDTLASVEWFEFADGTKSAMEVLTQTGTSGDDTLSGDETANVLKGLGGDDSLDGAGDADTLIGGAGNDTLDGGFGTDWALYADAASAVSVDLATGTAADAEGDDSLAGIENVAGSAHNDSFQGDGADNSFTGAAGADTLDGAAGGDSLEGGAGDDQLGGGAGLDTAIFTGNFSQYQISRDGDTGRLVVIDTVVGRDGTDTLESVEYLQFADARHQAGKLLGTFGTAANDSLVGTAFDDWIEGLAGNDRLLGALGNDLLLGGSGNDSLDGGDGVDTASYSDAAGAVSVSLSTVGVQVTGAGSDTLVGIENLVGGIGNDSLAGSDAANELYGGVGDDTLAGMAGDDALGGDAGDDLLAGNGGADTLMGGDGNDVVYAGVASADWSFPDGASGGVPPALDTASEGDQLAGGAGDDRLFAGYGDTVDGGDGNDTLFISFQGATEGVHADFAGIYSQSDVTAGTTFITNVEHVDWLEGSEYDDYLANNSSADFGPVYGRGGNDHIVGSYYAGDVYGGDGNDLIDTRRSIYDPASFGDAGDDTLMGDGYLAGGEGDDSLTGYGMLVGGAGNDTLDAEGSSSRLDGGDGDDLIKNGDQAYWIAGGAGVDTVTFYGARSEYTISFDSATGGYKIKPTGSYWNVPETGVEFLQFADETVATADLPAGPLLLHGTSGHDYMQGLQYDDTLYGGKGNDTLDGGLGNDLLKGEEGANWVTYAGADGGVAVSLQAGTATGAAGNDTLTNIDNAAGSTFADTLTGNASANMLHGGEGNDSLKGGNGNDTLSGGDGDDTAVFSANRSFYVATYSAATDTYTVTSLVANGEGRDSVTGVEWFQFADGTSSASDVTLNPVTLNGTTGADSLQGGDGNDNLYGGKGSDTLDGALGNDLLDGGADQDTVTYASAATAVTVSLLAGTATGAGTDTLVNIENVIGSAYGDLLTGSAGANRLQGGDGNDTLAGGAETDGIEGGAGIDTMVLSGSQAGYSVTYSPQDKIYTVSQLAPGGGYDWATGVEFFQFADGTLAADQVSQVLFGTTWAETLEGGNGNDSLYGSKGNDTLIGGLGNDLLDGQDGSDTVTYASASGAVSATLSSATGAAGTDTLSNIENLTGSAYNDTLSGNAGANTVQGGDGDDHINGGAGSDQLLGGAGIDTVSYTDSFAAVAVDLGAGIASGWGVDTLSGFENAVGSNSADALTGTSADNRLLGSMGPDTLNGAGGDDTLNGGDDLDLALYGGAAAGVTVDLASGAATGGDGNDTLMSIEGVVGSTHADAITGNELENLLKGGGGDDSILGAGGPDTLSGEAGDDWVDGGGSIDWAMYTDAAGAVTVSLTTGLATGAAGNDVLAGIENVGGSAYNDSLVGDGGANWVLGGAGNDTLAGGGGNDTLDGGTGTDVAVFPGNLADYAIFVFSDHLQVDVAQNSDDGSVYVAAMEWFQFADVTKSRSELVPLTGTIFNDTLTGTALNDILYGAAGNDMLVGGLGNDTLEGGADNDILNGGDGSDTASYAGSFGGVKVSLAIANSQATLAAGSDTLVNIEHLTGGGFNDNLTGNALANKLEGGLGDDSLAGGLGNDTLAGGAGNDSYTVDAGDTLVEASGEGFDTVNSVASFTLGANLENLTLLGKLLINGTGNEVANVIAGNAGANMLTGNAGDDTLNGAAGNDTLQGGDGNDRLDGGAGADPMTGGLGDDIYVVDNTLDQVIEGADQGIDTVNAMVSHVMGANVENMVFVVGSKAAVGTGNALDNLIVGNTANNTLNGAAGNDTLEGKLGADILTGGAGDDVFRFNTALIKNIDKITDFNAAADTIELDNTIFTGLGEGALSSAAFQSGASSVATTADARIIFNTATGALLYDADGIGGVVAVPFATLVLAGLAGPVTAADFVVT